MTWRRPVPGRPVLGHAGRGRPVPRRSVARRSVPGPSAPALPGRARPLPDRRAPAGLRGRHMALAATLVPAAIGGACSYAEGPEPYRPPAYYSEVDAEDVALGAHLYRRDCSFCHGNEGRGTDRGPDLVSGANGPALTDFMLRTGRMPIGSPDDPARPGDPVYDEAEIAALVAYLDGAFDQAGPGIPDVDPRGADLSAGLARYQEHCAACHATTGIGGAMLARDRQGDLEGVHIPGLGGSSPREVGEAVRTGPGAMPRFGPGTLGDDELDAIARYVRYLQEPEDKGGWPIGHVGPVAEGAVGWVVGLGALLLFIRWVGTRRGEQA